MPLAAGPQDTSYQGAHICRLSSSVGLSVPCLRLHLYHHFDFYRDAERKLIHADCGTGMSPPFTIEGNQEIGSAVNDFRLIREIFRAIDKPQHFNDASYLVKIANFSLNRLEDIKHHLFCRFISLLNRQLSA